MQLKHLTANEREVWNAFVASEPSFALQQSWEWGEFKEKSGWRVLRVALEEQGQIIAGAQMLIKSFPVNLASVAYVPRGPVGKWLDDARGQPLLGELHRIARSQRAIFLKIEPPLTEESVVIHALRKYNFRAAVSTIQPRATIHIDLKPDLDTIQKTMRRRTREYINHSMRKGLVVRIGNQDDLAAFYDLMLTTGQRAGFRPRSRKYYEEEWRTLVDKKQVVLLMACYEDRVLAAHMACCFGNHAAFLHGASSCEYSALRPNHRLVWEAVKWAKAKGCSCYDLWGVPDEVGKAVCEGRVPPALDRTDGLWGVYRFKRGFSKRVVCYVGAYDYVYVPLLYRLTGNGLLGSDMMERIAVRMDCWARL